MERTKISLLVQEAGVGSRLRIRLLPTELVQGARALRQLIEMKQLNATPEVMVRIEQLSAGRPALTEHDTTLGVIARERFSHDLFMLRLGGKVEMLQVLPPDTPLVTNTRRTSPDGGGGIPRTTRLYTGKVAAMRGKEQ